MAIAIVNTWTGTLAPATSITPPLPPSQQGLQIPVANTAGDWMFCIAAWRPIVAGSGVTISVDDDNCNWWDPVALPVGTSPATGNVRVAVWRAPAAQAARYVMINPDGPCKSIAAMIIDVSGLSPYPSDTGGETVAVNSATTTGSITAALPASSALMFTVGVCDLDSATLSLSTGSGWTSLGNVSASNGADTTSDLQFTAEYQTTSTAETIAWSSTATADLCAFIGGDLVTVTAPSQPIATWPVTTLEIAAASGFQSTPDSLAWVPVQSPSRFLKFSMQQGKQYELSQLQAGTGTIGFDDPDGYLIPSTTAPSSYQVQWTGNGSTSNPAIVAAGNPVSVVGGATYTWAAWLAMSAAWSTGAFLQIDWQNASGHISYSTSSAATTVAGTQITLTATAPANATFCYLYLTTGGTPPSTTTFYAASAPGPTLILPQTVVWTAQNNATVVTLSGWNNLSGVDSGTPVRLRMSWPGGAWQVNWHGNGSTSSPQVSTPTIASVVVGTTYTASAWLGASTIWSSGMQLQIQWYTSGGSFISSTTATTTTGSTVPQLVTATGAAPATAATAKVIVGALGTPGTGITFSAAAAPYQPGPLYLIIPAGVTWSAQNSATLVSSSTWTPSILGPPSGTPQQVVFNGYIERIPPTWDASTYRGSSEATITDAWASMPSLAQPILVQEILNDQPYAYWPCTDASTATAAANFAPGNPNPLSQITSKYGGQGTAAFGGNSSAILGAQGTYLITSSVRAQASAGMWGVTGIPFTGSVASFYEGYNLACIDTNFPSIANGVTIEFWFQAVSEFPASPYVDPALLTIATSNAGQFMINLDSVSATGNMVLTQSAPVVQTTIANRNYLTAGSPLTQVVITFNRTAWTAYVHGQESASGSFTYTLAPEFSWLSLNGIFNSAPLSNYGGPTNTWLRSCNGYFGHCAVYDYELTPLRIATHYQAGNFGMAGDSASGRIERLAQAGGFGGRRVILQDTGDLGTTQVVSCQDVSSQPSTASINNIVTSTTPALAYVGTSGAVIYACKSYLESGSDVLQWTLGENVWAGEIPYTDCEFDNDPSLVINSIQLTQLDNQDVITSQVPAITNASVAQYGTITDWTTGYLEGDLYEPLTFGPGLYDLANWLATTFAQAQTRVSKVVVNAASYPPAWPFFMQVSPGDLITVNRRPPTQATTLSVTARVISVQRDLDWESGQAEVTCMLVYAPEQFILTCDSSTLGQLSGNNQLGW